MSDSAIHGPVDFVLIEFAGDRLTGGAADALMDLVDRDRGIVRVYDLLVIRKDSDGSFSGIDISDSRRTGSAGSPPSRAPAPDCWVTTTSVRLPTQCSPAPSPHSSSTRTRAIPFVAAARDAGGQLIASARIPAQDVIDALDAVDAVH